MPNEKNNTKNDNSKITQISNKNQCQSGEGIPVRESREEASS